MSKQNDELLNKVAQVKKAINERQEIIDKAKTNKAILESKMADLTERLAKLVGTSDWSKARQLLERLQQQAQTSFEKLAEALDGVDIDLR